MKTTIVVKGTHCQSCKILIEEACSEIPEVKSCTIDLKTGKTVVEHDGTVSVSRLKKEIESLGEYTVS